MVQYTWKKEFERYHRITLPRLQSMGVQTLTENNAIYSQSDKKLIILGRNSDGKEDTSFLVCIIKL